MAGGHFGRHMENKFIKNYLPLHFIDTFDIFQSINRRIQYEICDKLLYISSFKAVSMSNVTFLP